MSGESSGYSLGRVCSLLICLVIVALAIALPVYYLSGEETKSAINNATGVTFPDFPNLPPSLRDKIAEIRIFQKEDPFNMVNPEDANRWENDGSGLELEMVNALDQQWYEYFDIAVDEWENGDPDALSLKTTVANQPDNDCEAIDGLQKVCNGDYGKTDWKGINKVLLINGWIIASMARMNDHFFVEGGDADKRQYTMCHEIGTCKNFGMYRNTIKFRAKAKLLSFLTLTRAWFWLATH